MHLNIHLKSHLIKNNTIGLWEETQHWHLVVRTSLHSLQRSERASRHQSEGQSLEKRRTPFKGCSQSAPDTANSRICRPVFSSPSLFYLLVYNCIYSCIYLLVMVKTKCTFATWKHIFLIISREHILVWPIKAWRHFKLVDICEYMMHICTSTVNAWISLVQFAQ